MVTSDWKRPASVPSRWGPVRIKASNRSSKMALIDAHCRKSQKPRLALPTRTSVVPNTMKKILEENDDADASHPRQTPDSETFRYVPRLGRATPDVGHRRAQLCGTLLAPGR